MLTPAEIKQRLEQVFDGKQATVLTEILLGAYGELVKSSDLNELKTIVKELAEAQKRTEQRMEELAEAQRIFTQEHLETRRGLGGLAMTVGYTLENEAFKALPELLQRDFGIIVKDRIKRQYVTDNKGKSIEVNIIVEASKEGKEMVIVGEAKSQLSKNDVDNFIRRKLSRLEGMFKEVFPLLITHMTTAPDIEEYVRQKGIALYYSYDF